jgi:hypothetical protein
MNTLSERIPFSPQSWLIRGLLLPVVFAYLPRGASNKDFSGDLKMGYKRFTDTCHIYQDEMGTTLKCTSGPGA